MSSSPLMLIRKLIIGVLDCVFEMMSVWKYIIVLQIIF